jgi:hypothetical protein
MHNHLQWVSWLLLLLSALTYIKHDANTLNEYSEVLLGHQLFDVEVAKRNLADSSFIIGRGRMWGGGTSTADDGESYVLRNSGHHFHCGIVVCLRNAGCVIAT